MARMMDALVKPERAPGLVLTQVPVPTPGPGEVLIKIRKTAICGTDVHIYKWDDWSQKNLNPPLVVGHEYVGEVAELGAGVEGLKIGQRVSGEGHIVCGHCYNCRTGNGQWCRNTKGVGVNRDGAFAEYLCIPATNVITIEDDLPDDIVSFFDAFGNATHTALMWELVAKNVLITGAGPIGMMAAAIAKYAGARSVTITDVNEYRLGLAKKLGATRPVNVAKEKLEDVMVELGCPEGFDVGLEMSGSGAALNQLLKSMMFGGKVSLLGIAGPDTKIDWNDIIFKGLRIQGIYGRKMFETWYQMKAMVQGGLDLTPMVTHRFNYRDFEKGFEAMISGNSGKVVLDWTK
ncbi:MAG: L-threonine 3-dehydrogenase [Clostridiaceae bacterium]|nr:L-threonine 3-dehydrogenase [Clostridiaceae bacterium]